MQHKRIIVLAAALLCGTVSVSAHAELSPTALPGDTRLVEFEYDADNTYLILTKPKAATHLELAADEEVQTIAAGDTKHWEIQRTANGRHVFVKPTYPNQENPCTIITTKRTYQIVFRSTDAGAKWYQRVNWRHGQTVLLDIAQIQPKAAEQGVGDAAGRAAGATKAGDDELRVNPSKMRFGYQVIGDAEFKPVAIFDDGTFTWIKMPPQVQELPALFAQTDEDDYQLVNYVVKGEHIVAQRLLKAGVLKLGKSEVRFVREATTAGGSRGRFLAN